MNRVKLIEAPHPEEVQAGDLFEDPQDGEIFILSQLGLERFVGVSLKDGGYWRSVRTTGGDAVRGLHFKGRGMTITVHACGPTDTLDKSLRAC